MIARALALSLALLPGVALAQYNYLQFKNLSSSSAPMPYFIDSRSSAPGGVALSEVDTAVTHAWNSWNAVSCAVPKVSRGGLSVGTVADPESNSDQFNVTPVWLLTQSSTWNNLFASTGAAAITIPLSYAGVLQQCDTYFNGVNRQWSTSLQTPNTAMDVESVMLHEAGHCLGLDHNIISTDDVMYSFIFNGDNKRVLTANDTQALCTRYPVSNAVGAPCGTGGSGCGTGRKCITQPMGSQPAAQYCSVGCDLAVNQMCDFPYSCQASTDFPGQSGSCQLPGTSVTQVGKSCGTQSECNASIAYCQTSTTAPSGNDFWVNGYCSQQCQAGQPACPAGSACTDVGFANPICLQSCRIGLADCRGGYACANTVNGGVCVPVCYDNRDCGGGSLCRQCDGLCVAANSTGAMIGDLCDSEAQCGPGMECLPLSPTSVVKQCTLACGVACGACSNGSTCHPLGGNGPSYCLRDCQTGTCGLGLQCGQLSSGRGCVPSCTDSLQCPVGFSCITGECRGPDDDDAGCTFCPKDDAGHPIVITPRDGGTGGGGSGGCGCSGGPSSLLLFAAAALWLRRRAA